MNLGVFFTAFGMVLLMEMGDKTQLLVMACAARYKPRQVLAGIFVSIVLLNLLAVFAGVAIGRIKVIQDCVQAAASLLFIIFGLMSLRSEDEEASCSAKGSGKGAIWTIAIAFFLAELGDKTQLSTFSFAALYPNDPVWVFAGSTLALLAADCIGLIAGAVAIKYIPKRVMALISALLFVVFGLVSGWITLRDDFHIPEATVLLIVCFTAMAAFASGALILARQKSKKNLP